MTGPDDYDRNDFRPAKTVRALPVAIKNDGRAPASAIRVMRRLDAEGYERPGL